jgi:hypothetical protein
MRFVLVEHIEEAFEVALETGDTTPSGEDLSKAAKPWQRNVPPQPPHIGLN